MRAVLIVGGAGAGSIGLYAAAIARALGSEGVTYVDADAGRRATAEGFGAEALEPGPERLGPFAITVDASGDPAGLGLALSSTAPDGVCTSTAIYFGEPVPMPLFEMYLKIVTFETGRVHARPAMPAVLDLAAGDGFRPQDVTTRVVAWDDAPAALLERGLGEAGRPAGGLVFDLVARLAPGRAALVDGLARLAERLLQPAPERPRRLSGGPLPAAQRSVAASLHVTRETRCQDGHQEQQHAESDYGSDQHREGRLPTLARFQPPA